MRMRWILRASTQKARLPTARRPEGVRPNHTEADACFGGNGEINYTACPVRGRQVLCFCVVGFAQTHEARSSFSEGTSIASEWRWISRQRQPKRLHSPTGMG